LALALETKPPFSIAATSDAVPNAADDATGHATGHARTTRIDELKARRASTPDTLCVWRPLPHLQRPAHPNSVSCVIFEIGT
jgi:hypothetical protein